jgi:hypothetical protein
MIRDLEQPTGVAGFGNDNEAFRKSQIIGRFSGAVVTAHEGGRPAHRR